MPNVYTRTGDAGNTALYGGSRVLKNDLRVDAYGTVDEAESNVGFARSILSGEREKELLLKCQERMFILSAQLASDEKGRERLKDKISQNDISYLEENLDYYLDIIGKQFSFVRPGENPESAALHVARTVVRRAERRMIDLSQLDSEQVTAEMLKFVNRLSDLLFVLAQYEDYHKLENQVREIILELTGRTRESATVENDKMETSFLALAKRMAAASRIKAKELGVPIVFAAVDKDGNLVYFEREPDSLLVSISVAQRKAYTSAALRLPTGDLRELNQPDGDLYDINTIDGGLIVFAGGLPVYVDGNFVGAIGVSGGTSSQDEEIAKAGIDII